MSYESEQNALVKLSVSVKKKIGEGGVEIEKIRWIRYKGITIKNTFKASFKPLLPSYRISYPWAWANIGKRILFLPAYFILLLNIVSLLKCGSSKV